MSFFKKMFARKNPVEEMRQLHARKDWAGVLSIAMQLERDGLAPAILEEIASWEQQAGDALAATNLEEGLWAQKTGNLLRARDDFKLALAQARSATLRAQAEQALAALGRGDLPRESEAEIDGPAIHAGCSSSCATQATPPATAAQDMDLDEEGRLELLLATMPSDLAQRYMASGPAFRQAWLAAQDGDEAAAMALLQEVPAAERNALFLYERGALMARAGQPGKALQDLQAALAVEPDLFPAFDALVAVLSANGSIDDLEKRLKQSLAAGRFIGYCWAHLANLHAQRREAEPALTAGLKALEEGIADQGLILLCAQLLEQSGQAAQAEALLHRLPAGGCGGGTHPMLAEFWLRQGQHLNKALESFKGALRQERDNPRWVLRIAQVYLAKGWHKDAAEQVERLMRLADLPEQIRSEVKALADRLQKS